MSRFLRASSLSIFFLVLFVVALVGQAIAGWLQFNDQQVAQGMAEIGMGRYLTSADFAVDVTENWQSEYLQFLLVHRRDGVLRAARLPGVAGARRPRHRPGAEARPVHPGRLPRVGQGGWGPHRDLRVVADDRDGLDLPGVLAGPVDRRLGGVQRDAAATAAGSAHLGRLRVEPGLLVAHLQNWQSEFLAVGSMAVLAIYLRQRGSAESKPVGEPHDSTGDEGA